MANKTPIVKVQYEMLGHGNMSRARVYTCKEYEIRVHRPTQMSELRVIVNTPKGDPDEEAIGELIAAIIKDQP